MTGRVHELLEAGEGDDLVEPGAHLALGHPEDGAVEVGVLEPGQLTVEPGADLEQRADPTPGAGAPLGRRGDAVDHLEQGALAGAVGADDPERASLVDAERHVAQRPDLADLAPRRAAQATGEAGDRLAQVGALAVVLAEAVALADGVELDDGAHDRPPIR